MFPNSTRFQSNKCGCGGSLHSKRNKRKQRHSLCPSLEWPADFFPGKMCSGRGGSIFVAAAWIQSLRASAAFSGAQVWDPEPQSQWGVRGWAGGIRPAQPRSKPLAHKVPERRMAGELLGRMRPAPGSTRSRPTVRGEGESFSPRSFSLQLLSGERIPHCGKGHVVMCAQQTHHYTLSRSTGS